MISLQDLIHTIEKQRLVDAHQVEWKSIKHKFTDAHSCAAALREKGWITAFQVRQIMSGEADSLSLGPYLLLDQIGEGGMGYVYRAIHRILKSVRAIKTIRPECLVGTDAVERFYREIELVSSLNHPNIILAHDAGHEGEIHYFVMEYSPGRDLAHLLKDDGPLPVATACDYIRQSSLGLQHAHERGLVHRDIKPSNLLVSEEGVVKLLDLGLARLRDRGLITGDTDNPLTPSGAVVGTPDFMAPEQADDPTLVDIRADIYALGCAFYQVLAGQLPFPGGSYVDKLIHHRSSRPMPLTHFRDDVPEEVRAILNRMIEKSPANRYQTPAEVALALAPFSSTTATAVRIPLQPTGSGLLDRTEVLGTGAPRPESQHPPTLSTPSVEAPTSEPPSQPPLDSITAMLKEEMESIEGFFQGGAQTHQESTPVPKRSAAWLVIPLMIIVCGVAAFLPWSEWFASVPGPTGSDPGRVVQGTGKRPVKPPPKPVKDQSTKDKVLTKDRKDPPDPNRDKPPVKDDKPPLKDKKPPVKDKPDPKDMKKDRDKPTTDKPIKPKPPDPPPLPPKGIAKKSAPDAKAGAGKPGREPKGIADRPLAYVGAKPIWPVSGPAPVQSLFSHTGDRALLKMRGELQLVDLKDKPKVLQSYRPSSLLGLLAVPGTPSGPVALSAKGDSLVFATVALAKDRIRNNPPRTRYNTFVLINSDGTKFFYGKDLQIGRDRQMRLDTSSLAFQSTGKAFFAGGFREITKWEINQRAKDQPTQRYRCSGIVTALACSTRGKYLAAGLSDGNISIFIVDSDKRDPYCAFKGDAGLVRSVTFLDQNTVLAGTSRGDLLMWKIPAKAGASGTAPTRHWKEYHSAGITMLSGASDGKHFLTGDTEGELKLGSREQAEPLWVEKTGGAPGGTFNNDASQVRFSAARGIMEKDVLQPRLSMFKLDPVNTTATGKNSPKEK